jgi:hypothetical protein
MNKLVNSPRARSKSATAPVQAIMVAAVLFAPITAYADTVTLVESQTEKVKCVTVKDKATNEKHKECVKTSTGKYTVTAKLALKTLMDKGLDVFSLFGAGIPLDTPLGMSIGDFEFASTLGDATKRSKISGTWNTSHQLCIKTDAASGDCLKTKKVLDGTVSLGGGLSGVIIKLTGNSDSIAGFGESIFASACAENGTGSHTASASVTIGDFNLSLPVAINCRVNTSTYDPDAIMGGPFNLVNMNINAKLGIPN